MTVVATDSELLLDQATALLHDTQALLDSALAHLRSLTLEGDQVSSARLDAYQLVSYELALCSADLSNLPPAARSRNLRFD